MTLGIYCIENLINGKKYIGRSVNIEKRFATHKCLLQKHKYHKGCNRYLWNAVQKYGLSNFKFYVLEDILSEDKNILYEKELLWMDRYSSWDRTFGYNLLRQSDCCISHSDETKTLMSLSRQGRKMPLWWVESRRGKKLPEDWCKAISKGKTGIKHSPEYIEAVKEGKTLYSYEQYSLSGDLLNTYLRLEDIRLSGYDAGCVQRVCRGERKSHRGFIWKRIDKINT